MEQFYTRLRAEAGKPAVLREAFTDQLRDRPLKVRDTQRPLNALGWRHDRGNRVWFLEDPRGEPTNTWGIGQSPPR